MNIRENKQINIIISMMLILSIVFAFMPQTTYASTIKTPYRVVMRSPYIGDSYVTLRWKKTKNATGYKVYKVTLNSTGKYVYKLLKSTKSLSSTVNSLKTNTTYRFAVKAYNKKDGRIKNGRYSEVKKVKTLSKVYTPYRPTLKISKVTNNTVALKWDKKKSAVGYKIYKVTKNSKGNNVYTRLFTTKYTSYTVKNLKENTTYHFAVRAYNEKGIVYRQSGYSSIKSAKTISNKTQSYLDHITFGIKDSKMNINIDNGYEDFGEYVRLDYKCSTDYYNIPVEDLIFEIVSDPNNSISMDEKGLITLKNPGIAKVRVTTAKTKVSEECEITVYRISWKGKVDENGFSVADMKLSDKEINLKDYIEVAPSTVKDEVFNSLNFSLGANNFHCTTLKDNILSFNNGDSCATIKAGSDLGGPKNELVVEIAADCVLPVDKDYMAKHNSSEAYIMYEGETGDRSIKIERGAVWNDVKDQVGTVDAIYPRKNCDIYVYDINYGYMDGQEVECDGDFDHFLAVYVYKETGTIAGWVTNQKQLAVINGKEIIRGETKLSELTYLFAENSNIDRLQEGNIRYDDYHNKTENSYDRASLVLLYGGESLYHDISITNTIAFIEVVPQAFREWDSQALGGKDTDSTDDLYFENQINMCRIAYNNFSSIHHDVLKHDTSLSTETEKGDWDNEEGRLCRLKVGYYDLCDIAYNCRYLCDVCIQWSETNKYTATDSLLVTDIVRIGRTEKSTLNIE